MTIKVRKKKENKNNSTDISLLVANDVSCEYQNFDKNKIIESLIKEVGIDEDIANNIANNVENKILKSDTKEISVSLVRELVDNELFLSGFNAKLKKHKTIGIPTFNLDELIFSKTNENSNLSSNNPEAINMAISENVMKQYALSNVFSEDIANAHLKGRIHLHDLGCITRNYCSSHSIDFIKKYGLELENLTTQSAPAKHASTLTGHINTFLSSIQTYYAGALGLANVNIAYAPYLVGMSYNEILQEAQYLIYSCAQNAFSRGGQTLFIDFNIHTGIPEYMKNLPAIGKGGEYTGKTYSEYEKEAQLFAKALMEVWQKGDKNGQIFAFPKMDFHINNETFDKKEQYDLLKFACQISSENGVPYFIFDRDAITLSACCFTGEQTILYKENENDIFKCDSFRDIYNNVILEYKKDVNNTKKIFIEHNGEIIPCKVICLENYKNPLYKIKTINNMEICVTENHLNPTSFGDIKSKDLDLEYKLKCIYNPGLNNYKLFEDYDIINNETFIKIRSIDKIELKTPINVYCLEIEDGYEPYFTLPNGIITHNCRLRTTLNMADEYDKMMIERPESMRYCGFQNITINLPQAAYRAGKGNIKGVIDDIYESMDICIKAHFQKKEFISKLMQRKGLPLWQMGKKSPDGLPYIDLERASYIMGMVGLNECVQFLCGEQLHESDNAFKLGLQIISSMFLKINEYSKKYNLKFVLEESPAESATRRMAKIDLKKYPESKEYIKGDLDSDEFYYTNSIHFAAGIDMPIIERIQKQSKFHSLIAAGAIIHAFIGEENPSPESILNLVNKTWKNTNCAQLTVSPEFTICNSCHKMTRGIKNKCEHCGAENVAGIDKCISCK
jgi:anaerobic ribonucleoside-triphosphate reductase